MNCDVGEATEGLENEQSSFSNLSVTSPTSQIIFQPFRHFTTSQLILEPFCSFTYVTAQSATLLLLYLHHSSFSNSSIASPTSQLILQPFFCFSYITGSSLTSPGEPPMVEFFVYRFWQNIAFIRRIPTRKYTNGE